ncbi:MAG TPA: kelch repeat-containing protein, partial [Woeseiaceae bacterium]|nr:kelch repeat-containing protein [Woeseiaceae bacterium]
MSFCLALAAPVFVQAGPEDPADGGQWGPVMDWPHIAVSAANLPDGRILTWSGSERETWPTTEQTYSATWDPETGEFVEVFHEGHNMFCAHLAMLEDGRVFVNGGRNQTNSPWTSIFDFRDNEWLQIENMDSGGRWYPTTVALADGDILTAIGTASLQQYPERWNVDDGWEIKNGIDFGEMVLTPYFNSGTHGESRWWPLLHVAPNGQIFHSGPTPRMHYIDPEGNGSFQQVGPEMTDFYHKHGTTIMYDEGKLLTAGGWVAGGNIASSSQSFTIDLNGPSPVVAATNSMNFARKFHNGVMLPTGDVLVVGGNTSGRKFNDTGTIYATEIWDPDTGTWTVGASMVTPRNYHSIALLLTDGRVLAAGGGYCSGSAFCGGSSHRDGEIYSPPYLFNADNTPAIRPEITSGPARVNSGNTFAVSGTPGL